MQSPLTIGFLSIIPGLGFLVLRKYRLSALVIAIILVLLATFLFVPNEFLSQLSCQLVVLAWIGQIYYAYQTARLIARQESGEAVKPREITDIPPPPSELSANERLAYKMREIVRQQLNAGEHLIEAICAYSLPSMGSHILIGPVAMFSARSYYVGLTQNDLILIEQDFIGKPADIKRISLSDLKSSEMKKGLLNDKLILFFNDNKSLTLQVTFRLRPQTQAIFLSLQNAG